MPVPGELPPVAFVRNPRARRYILRVDSRGVRVTLPRGGSAEYAARFVQQKQGWIRAQIERLRADDLRACHPATEVWYRGVPTPITLQDGCVRVGDLAFRAPSDPAQLRAAVLAQLRHLAERELPPLVRETAQRLDVRITRVSIRNQRTRWGSCSRHGTISLNWRLVQIPQSVRDYLIAHELAHVREMNHSHRFWKVVECFDPGWRESERWLRRHGRDVMRR